MMSSSWSSKVDPESIPGETADTTTDAVPHKGLIVAKVRAAKEEAKGKRLVFFKKYVGILCGTTLSSICLGLYLGIPIAQLVIGSIYLYDCTIQRFIPIYLLVTGAFGMVKVCSSMVQRLRNAKKDQEDDENVKSNPIDGAVTLFLFIWFIIGNVWVYEVYKQVVYDDNTSASYCDQNCYLFAVWIIIVQWIIGGLGVFCVFFTFMFASTCTTTPTNS